MRSRQMELIASKNIAEEATRAKSLFLGNLVFYKSMIHPFHAAGLLSTRVENTESQLSTTKFV